MNVLLINEILFYRDGYSRIVNFVCVRVCVRVCVGGKLGRIL